MTRLTVLVLVATLFGAASVGAATRDEIVAALGAQGFAQIHVEETFLGRVRIVAETARMRREIVLNPQTGEILRDYSEPLGGGSGGDHHLAGIAPAPAIGAAPPVSAAAGGGADVADVAGVGSVSTGDSQ